MHIGWSHAKAPAVNESTTPSAVTPQTASQKPVQGANFEALMHTMEKASDQAASLQAKKGITIPVLKFSNHAVERMSDRGIHFTPEEITKMEEATQKAAQKGGREALLITKDNAAIVSLKNNTVVTVVDRNSLKNNVFTNIDATVFI